MKIITTGSYYESLCYVYAIIYDTGHFYIGCTKNFTMRQRQHVSLMKKKGWVFDFLHHNNPSVCKFILLEKSKHIKRLLEIERFLILINSTNPLLLNTNKGDFKLHNINNKLWQKLKDLSEDPQNQ